MLVWLLLFVAYRYLFTVGFLRMLRSPLLVFGPWLLYPPVLWVVLRYQLPPLSARYIRAMWFLWIPGYLVACLPSIDFLMFGKRIIRQVFFG